MKTMMQANKTQLNSVAFRPFEGQSAPVEAAMESAVAAIQDPAALAGPLVGISFLAGFATAMATAKSPYPRPGSTPEQIQTYFQESATAARISATGQLLSSAALIPFTAAVLELAGQTDEDRRWLETAVLAGGGLATAGLAISAVCTAALTGRAGRQAESAAKLSRWAFLAGGLVHGVGFGLLVGSLGLAGLRTGALPRPLAQAGLASGVAGLLSPLYLLAEPAGWIIPLGRFSGLLISGIAGVQLARRAR